MKIALNKEKNAIIDRYMSARYTYPGKTKVKWMLFFYAGLLI